MYSYFSKKYLGQHFLTDKNIAKKIVDSLRAENTGTVVEIGPGRGILTGYLVKNTQYKTYIVEIDKKLVEQLFQSFPGLRHRIFHSDFLEFDISGSFKSPVAIIGNLPYNISSQIFFKILENKDKVVEMVGMVQKEVAERIKANPGSKTYGILSVLLQAYYDVEYLFTVSEKVFEPQPRVKSAVIRLTRNNTRALYCDEELFTRVVKITFNQRRKILRNSLRSILLNLKLDHELMARRPEELSVSQFVLLTRLVKKSFDTKK
jgi:16S rRNA (adenine1518-N6/adenine1519-N6)-dimethyltransferase